MNFTKKKERISRHGTTSPILRDGFLRRRGRRNMLPSQTESDKPKHGHGGLHFSLSFSLPNFYFHHPCDEVTFPFVLDSHILLLWSKIEYSTLPSIPIHSHAPFPLPHHPPFDFPNKLLSQPSQRSNGKNMQQDDTPSLSIKKNVVLFYSRCYLRFVADISSNMFLK